MRVQMHFQRIIEKFRNETNDSDDKLPAIAENNLFPLYPLSFIFKKSLNLWCHTIRHCCHVYLVWLDLVLVFFLHRLEREPRRTPLQSTPLPTLQPIYCIFEWSWKLVVMVHDKFFSLQSKPTTNLLKPFVNPLHIFCHDKRRQLSAFHSNKRS